MVRIHRGIDEREESGVLRPDDIVVAAEAAQHRGADVGDHSRCQQSAGGCAPTVVCARMRLRAAYGSPPYRSMLAVLRASLRAPEPGWVFKSTTKKTPIKRLQSSSRSIIYPYMVEPPKQSSLSIRTAEVKFAFLNPAAVPITIVVTAKSPVQQSSTISRLELL